MSSLCLYSILMLIILVALFFDSGLFSPILLPGNNTVEVYIEPLNLHPLVKRLKKREYFLPKKAAKEISF